MSPTDPCEYLGFRRNADGSLTRLPEFNPGAPASADPANPVLSKDVPINPQIGTWARLYLPRSASPSTKLPLIVYYHGGGFVICSAATSIFQKFLFDIALEIPAVIVSVEYRLAPEHRLPAAYDDCEEALRWIGDSDDEWLTQHADLSNCYIMGTSAGGNIAYHVGLRAAAVMKIKGLILHTPFFGGKEMTPSEIRLADDKVLPEKAVELMWGLSLPVGADRDHEYCNPTKEVKVELMEKVKEKGTKILITGCDGDPLIDRQIELTKILKDKGLNVIELFSEGGFHGVELADPSRAAIFMEALNNFINT